MLHRGRAPLHSKDEDDQVPWASLCPTMDLVAFCCAGSSSLAIYRSIDWERLALPQQQQSLEANCTGSMAWRPDGKQLAVALESGQVALIRLESASSSSSSSTPPTGTSSQQPHASSVMALAWTSWLGSEESEAEDEFAELRREQCAFASSVLPKSVWGGTADVLLPLQRLHDNVQLVNDVMNNNNQESPSDEEEDTSTPPQQLDVLVVGTADGRVSLRAFGHLPLAELSLAASPPCGIAQVSLSAHTLTVLTSDPAVLYTYDASRLHAHASLLLLVCESIHLIASEFALLQRTLQLLQRLWQDLLAGLKKFLSPLIQHDSALSVSELLFDLITMGATRPEVKRFLDELSASALQRITRLAEHTMLVVCKLLEVEVARAVEALLYRVGVLLAVDLREVGLAAQWKHERVHGLQVLLQVVHACCQVARDTARDLSAVVRAIEAALARYKGEAQEAAGDEEEFARVRRFVADRKLDSLELSLELGVRGVGNRYFSAQAIAQSWDRDVAAAQQEQEEDEEEGSEGGRLFALVGVAEAEWTMSATLVSQAMSRTLREVEPPRELGVKGGAVQLAEDAVAYVQQQEDEEEDGSTVLVVERFVDGRWTRQLHVLSMPCDGGEQDGEEDGEEEEWALAFCGPTPGKPAAVAEGRFIVAPQQQQQQRGGDLAVVGGGECVIIKTVPRSMGRTRRLVRLAASGPRGVCCALTDSGHYLMYDLAFEQEEEPEEEDEEI